MGRLGDLNRHLKGWANYYRPGYSRCAFRQINRYVRERLTKHLRRRRQRAWRPPEGSSIYSQLERMGLIYYWFDQVESLHNPPNPHQWPILLPIPISPSYVHVQVVSPPNQSPQEPTGTRQQFWLKTVGMANGGSISGPNQVIRTHTGQNPRVEDK